MTRIKVVYENGVFRPIDPVSIEDGCVLEIGVELPGPLKDRADPIRARERLREIAAMPDSSAETGSFGRDHDAILYRADWKE